MTVQPHTPAMMQLWRISRWPLMWLAGIMAGIGIFFATEPAASLLRGMVLSSVALALSWQSKSVGRLRLPAVICAGIMLGYAAGHIRLNTLNTVFIPPQLEDHQLWLSGQITDITWRNSRRTLTLQQVTPYGDAALGDFPQKIRLSVFASQLPENIGIGDFIALQAKLYVPQKKQFPGDFNVYFYDKFQGIGARGYAFGDVYATHRPQTDATTPALWLQNLRYAIAERIWQEKEQPAAIAAALLTGLKGRLNSDTYNAFRQSGLAHLLTISGLHVGLVCAFLYLFIRRTLALSSILATRYTLKRATAPLVLAGGLFYVLLAGATLPTLRAFALICGVLLALWVNRTYSRFRLLIFVAGGILCLWPESLFSASFQLSFAATSALMLWAHTQSGQPHSRFVLVNTGDYIRNTFWMSLIASCATLPLVAWHFGQVSLAGVFANLLAVPLTGIVVLPLGLAALALMPLGMEHWPLEAMRYATHLLLWWAQTAAEWPFTHLPLAPLTLVLGAAGLVALLTLRRRQRYMLAGVCIALATAWQLNAAKPELWLMRQGATIAMVSPSQIMLLRHDNSSEESRLLQQIERRYAVPINHLTFNRCDSVGCSGNYAGLSFLTLHQHSTADAEDCRLSALVFAAPEQIGHFCKQQQRLALQDLGYKVREF